jgi:hypothetical protein
MCRVVAVAFVLAGVLTANGETVTADCAEPVPTKLLNDNRIAALFSGVLRTVQTVPTGRIIAFDVSRVWKGTVPQSVVIYNYIEPPVFSTSTRLTPDGQLIVGGVGSGTTGGGGGTMPLIVGVRYLVVAHRLTAFEREQFGLASDATLLGLGGCNGTNFYDLLERDGLLRPLGPSREPN